jgi:FkbM family methyltransferase
MVSARPSPKLDSFEPDIARRVAMTLSCGDADAIPKVDDAGKVYEQQGKRVQVMHNGLLVEAGGYYGDWMTEVIRALRGHHEPQEERVFDQIVRRLAGEPGPLYMIEFGSYWAYYALWFCKAIASGRAIAVEPDPTYLAVGKRNAALNDLTGAVSFVHGAIGNRPGQLMDFRAESDGCDHQVTQYDLGSVLETAGVDRVDVVLADVQGAETIILERGKNDFRQGRVRFLIVSTHHHAISGNPLTHQQAMALLTELGAHVICEHTVSESFSGDGLIAVSFDERDRDLTVEVSRARSKDSLFGEVEFDLATSDAQRIRAQQDAADMRAQFSQIQSQLEKAERQIISLTRRMDISESQRDELQQQLDAVLATKLWRWSQRPRQIYGGLRRSLNPERR